MSYESFLFLAMAGITVFWLYILIQSQRLWQDYHQHTQEQLDNIGVALSALLILVESKHEKARAQAGELVELIEQEFEPEAQPAGRAASAPPGPVENGGQDLPHR